MRSFIRRQPTPPFRGYRETLDTHRALFAVPLTLQPTNQPSSTAVIRFTTHYMVVTVINSLEEFNEIVSLFGTVVSDWLFFLNQWKVQGSSPVVIEFYARWCGPSRKINPTFDKCSERLQYDGLDFYRVDVDNQPVIVQLANIQKVRIQTCLVLFLDFGVLLRRWHGF